MVNLMTRANADALWIHFPKTLPEFEERFPDEGACYDYLLQLRWGGKPVCAKCGCHKTWEIRDRKLFECAECGHQTSLTAGTLMGVEPGGRIRLSHVPNNDEASIADFAEREICESNIYLS